MGNILVSIKALNEKVRCFTLIAFQLDRFSFSAGVKNSCNCNSTSSRVCIAFCLIAQVIIVKIFFLVALLPNADYGLLIQKVSRSHARRTTVGRTPLDE